MRCIDAYCFGCLFSFLVERIVSLLWVHWSDAISYVKWFRREWCFNDSNGGCWSWHLWSGRTSGSDGIWFCYGTISIFKKITIGAWTLELSSCWLSGSLQLLQKCSFCTYAVLVCTPGFGSLYINLVEIKALALLFILADVFLGFCDKFDV